MNPFIIEFEKQKLIGDTTAASSKCAMLCLHGGGIAGRKGLEPIRTALEQKGISTCAFDFMGQGDTGGDLKKSSLKKRTEQALAIIASLNLAPPVSLLASSMGGYTAIKIASMIQVDRLILLAPAVYDVDAYDKPFGSEFSTIIRKPSSWRNSDAWELLKTFKGDLLIFEAQLDDVIPHEIIERIYNSAIQARSREIVTVQNATHPLTSWLAQHSSDLEMTLNRVSQLFY